MRKKTVRIEKLNDQCVVVKARVGGKRIKLTPTRGGASGYCSDESAKRAWRKYARSNNVSNYEYVLV